MVDEVSIVPFERVGPYAFDLTRDRCDVMFGAADSERSHAGGGYHSQVRGECELHFDLKSGKFLSVWIRGGKPTWNGHSLFTKEGVEALRAADGGATEAGAWQHFPKFGIVIGSMGKRRTSEGPVVLVCTPERFAVAKFMR